MIIVSAAIIENENNEVLICQRPKSGSNALFWEFPGGKLEPNETIEQCLKRECFEELGIALEICSFYGKNDFLAEGKRLSLHFYKAKIIEGKITLNFHKDYKWTPKNKLSEFDISPADVSIANQLTNESQ